MNIKTNRITYGDGTVVEKPLLIADEGKLVTKDGVELFGAVAVDSVEGWYEVDEPDAEATIEDYEEALGRFGV